MGMLTLKEGDVVQQLPSKKLPRRLPPYNLNPEYIWHVKKITGGTALVDRYIDEKGERNLVAKDETIRLARINDDTVYKILNEVIFPIFVQLNTVTKVWTPVPRLYADLAAAKTGLGVADVAELKVTTNGKYYIADDTVVPKSK